MQLSPTGGEWLGSPDDPLTLFYAARASMPTLSGRDCRTWHAMMIPCYYWCFHGQMDLLIAQRASPGWASIDWKFDCDQHHEAEMLQVERNSRINSDRIKTAFLTSLSREINPAGARVFLHSAVAQRNGERSMESNRGANSLTSPKSSQNETSCNCHLHPLSALATLAALGKPGNPAG